MIVQDTEFCRHTYKIVSATQRRSTRPGNSYPTWTRLETFRCEVCLDRKEETREETSAEPPYWWDPHA